MGIRVLLWHACAIVGGLGVLWFAVAPDVAKGAVAVAVTGGVGGFGSLWTHRQGLRAAEQAVARLEREARADFLTGLPNRLSFDESLSRSLARAQRRGYSFAVLMIDLDGMKAVNDRHGHQAGDHLLVETAQRLKGLVRSEDVVARLGGDEFTAILSDVATPEAADVVGRRLAKSLSRPVAFADRTLGVGASIGIALYPWDGGTADDLLRRADEAMYAAKRRHGSAWVVAAHLPEFHAAGETAERTDCA